MYNLFGNLEKYSGNEKRTPHEEFFTQLVTYIIKSDDVLKKGVINFLVQNTAYKEDDFNNISIEPEYSEKGVGEFDIKIEHKKDLLMIVENKMGAREGKLKRTINEKEELNEKAIKEEEKQLDNYAYWLSKQEHKYKILILITYPYSKYLDVANHIKKGTSNKYKGISFRHLSWEDFHYFLSDYINAYKNHYPKDSKNSFLVDELKNYMEAEKMESWKPLKKDSCQELKELWKVYDNFNKILGDICETFKEALNKNLKKGFNERSSIYDYPSIYKEIVISKEIEMCFGFCVDDDEVFSFFIEFENKKEDLTKRIKNESYGNDYKIEYYTEDGYFYIDFNLPLSDVFFEKDYLNQKKDLKDFSSKVLNDINLKTI